MVDYEHISVKQLVLRNTVYSKLKTFSDVCDTLNGKHECLIFSPFLQEKNRNLGKLFLYIFSPDRLHHSEAILMRYWHLVLNDSFLLLSISFCIVLIFDGFSLLTHFYYLFLFSVSGFSIYWLCLLLSYGVYFAYMFVIARVVSLFPALYYLPTSSY